MPEAENTVQFIKSVQVDVSSAIVASLFLAPFITIVDVSIIKSTNGSMPLKEGLKRGFLEALLRPHQIFRRKEFFVVWGLYAGTYACANLTSSYCKFKNVDDKLPKQISTTAFNMPVCMIKDKMLAKWFSTNAVGRVPLTSLGCWCVRDSLTIGAAFTVVDPIGHVIAEKTGMSVKAGVMTSQLLCPCLIQVASTPLHLLGLDFFNRPGVGLNNRANYLSGLLVKSTLARQVRIGFAFGIGGVGNRTLHEKFMAAYDYNPPTIFKNKL